jgi:hypothetical protein
MWNDPIVEEVRKVREEHSARFDYDLERISRISRSKNGRAAGK